jgi:hypothetical protein
MEVTNCNDNIDNTNCNDNIDNTPYSINYKYKIMSIDIGITNLGVSITMWDESWNKFNVIWLELIDLGLTPHTKVLRKNCKLNHSRHIVDKMEHFFQEYSDYLNSVDYIIVELQPILGLKSVESLIYSKYRNKTILVHPVKMHIYFTIKHLDYEQRKEMTVKIAKNIIKDPHVMNKFNNYTRQHDIADSICIMKYWTSKKRETYISKYKKSKALENFNNQHHIQLDDFFNIYKYKPSF